MEITEEQRSRIRGLLRSKSSRDRILVGIELIELFANQTSLTKKEFLQQFPDKKESTLYGYITAASIFLAIREKREQYGWPEEKNIKNITQGELLNREFRSGNVLNNSFFRPSLGGLLEFWKFVVNNTTDRQFDSLNEESLGDLLLQWKERSEV